MPVDRDINVQHVLHVTLCPVMPSIAVSEGALFRGEGVGATRVVTGYGDGTNHLMMQEMGSISINHLMLWRYADVRKCI